MILKTKIEPKIGTRDKNNKYLRTLIFIVLFFERSETVEPEKKAEVKSESERESEGEGKNRKGLIGAEEERESEKRVTGWWVIADLGSRR